MAILAAIGALALAAAAPAPAATTAPAGPPAAAPLWSIGSKDCVSVHADGEPWDECGFQDFAMNAEGSRVLTVSTLGLIQLWDGDGRELRRIDWPDDRSGASGFPSGKAMIAGAYAVAVAHQNQLAIMDLTSGRILSQRVHDDVMLFDELHFVSPERLLARVKTKSWEEAGREVMLASGEARTVKWEDPGLIWIGGLRKSFSKLPGKPDGARAQKAAWTCKPLDGRHCFRRDLPGREIHRFDLSTGEGRSIDVGRTLGQFDGVQFAVAGEQSWAVICARSRDANPYLRPCEVLDLVTGRRIYGFDASNLRAEGGFDEIGRPELRLSLLIGFSAREQRRIALDGTMRVVDSKGRAALSAPGGGMVLPAPDQQTSLLIGADGRAVAALPFPAQACGNGWPDWWGWCRLSSDGRRLLKTAAREAMAGADQGDLTMYALPLVEGSPAQ